MCDKVYRELMELTKNRNPITYNIALQILTDEVEHEEDLQALKKDIRGVAIEVDTKTGHIQELSPEVIEKSRRLLEISEKDISKLRASGAKVLKSGQTIVNGLLSFLQEVPETKGLIEDLGTEAAKRYISKHLKDLFEGRHGSRRCLKLLECGTLLHKRGIPYWVVPAVYRKLMELVSRYLPREPSGIPLPPPRLALEKAVFFEMTAILNAYFLAEERRTEEAVRSLDRTVAIHRLTKEFYRLALRVEDPDQLIQEVLRTLLKPPEVEAVIFCTRDEGGKLSPYLKEEDQDMGTSQERVLEEVALHISKTSLEIGTPVSIHFLEEKGFQSFSPYGISHGISIPLRIHGKVKGTLNLMCSKALASSQGELELLTQAVEDVATAWDHP